MTKRLSVLLALLLWVAWPVGASASTSAFVACASHAAATNLEAQTRFQQQLRDHVADTRPALVPLATLNMDLQIALAELRRAKIEYLLARNPDRIETRLGFARFTNFGWSETDETKFLAESDENKAMQERVAQLSARNNGHADWPELRKYFRDMLGIDEGFKAIMAEKSANRRNVEELLEGCRRD